MEQVISASPAYQMAMGYEKNVVSGVFRYWTPILLKHVPPKPGDQVLDLACGTGIVARSMLPLIQPGGSVVGQDINKAMLAVAADLLPAQEGQVTWKEAPAENIPFPDQSFDLVLCQQGMQFFTSRTAAAGEIYRVLRKNGRVGIAVWQGLHTLPLYLKIFAAVNSMIPISNEGVNSGFSLGNPEELAGLLAGAGFKEVDVTPFSQDVFIDDPDLYTRMTMMMAVNSSAEFNKLDQPAQKELLAVLTQKVAPVASEYILNGKLIFTMYANIARGTRK